MATLVPVEIPSSVYVTDDLYFDGALDTQHEGLLVAEPGVVSMVTGEAAILIGLSSSQSKEKVLKKGTQLGAVSTVVDAYPLEDQKEESPPEVDSLIESDMDLQHLDPCQTEQVKAIMQNRAKALSGHEGDIGCAGVIEHHIELHDATPVRQKPRRFPEPIAREIERQCKELVDLDVIEYSRSPWSAPVVPIRKPDGTLRLCVDYRQLNKVTKADRFPMPNMNDLVFGLHGNWFFTTIDLVKIYYQVPLHLDSRECTAFLISFNHYQCKRLSFGLKNAPAAFQRDMQVVLQDFDRKQVIVYIDDVLILSKTFDEHLQLVDKVLATLVQYNLKIKLSMCSW